MSDVDSWLPWSPLGVNTNGMIFWLVSTGMLRHGPSPRRFPPTSSSIFVTMDVSPYAMGKPSHLCAVCLEFLGKLPEHVQETTRTWDDAKDQLFETFREAARRQCFICSTLWNLSEKYSATWSSPESVSWTPMHFIARQEPADPVIRLVVVYVDHIRGVTTDISFLMISTNGIAPIAHMISDWNKLNILRHRVRTSFLV